MEKIIATNKAEFGAKKRELINSGYRVFDREKACNFVKMENFKSSEVVIIKGWKRA